MKGTAATTGLTVSRPGDREILMTRVFDAPRERVFEAYTNPAQLKRWLGPQGWTLTEAETDLEAGGSYRFVTRGGDGMEMGWGGTYRQVVPNEGFVATERFDQPWYPGEALVTLKLSEQGGKTTLALTVRYESEVARDAVLATPMTQGVAESFARLEALLRG